jgi:hypothetical protein
MTFRQKLTPLKCFFIGLVSIHPPICGWDLMACAGELRYTLLYVGVPPRISVLAKGGSQKSIIENLYTGFTIAGVASLSAAAKEVRKKRKEESNNYYFDFKTKHPSKEDSILYYIDFSKNIDEFINN